MVAYLQSALIFLISTLFSVYISIVLIRFLLQLCRSDAYNPIAKFIYAATNPLLRSFGKYKFAPLLLALILQVVQVTTIMLIRGFKLPLSINGILGIFVASTGELVYLLCSIYIFSIIIMVIFSWVAAMSHNTQAYSNPLLLMLHDIVDPLLKPIRNIKFMRVSAVDLSPFFLILFLFVIQMILAGPIMFVGNTLIARG